MVVFSSVITKLECDLSGLIPLNVPLCNDSPKFLLLVKLINAYLN